MFDQVSTARAVVALILLSGAAAAQAQAWQALGPGPSHSGQVEGITNREVVGAVQAIAAHPTDANVLYIASVNGGVWRTGNATAAAPSWTRLTDGLDTLSLASLEFDVTDATRQTLVAGTGRVSSLGSEGTPPIGILRTTNGGTSWTALAGTGGPLNGRSIVGVAARGAVLMAATSGGLYRSTDTGATFTLVSGGASTGLPTGSTTDLAADPTSNSRFYTAVLTDPNRGIFRSTDNGATWTKVSDAAVDSVLNAGTGARRVRASVGAAGQVFLAIVGSNGRLAEVFRSADGVTGWTALGVPLTTEQNGVQFGIHPGGQGSIHLSVSADPTDANIVYVGGDRQPYFGEGVNGSTNFFPNSIGANDYSGRLFRADAAAPPASRWTPLTHSGAGNSSSPHADSRDMAFDAQGNLLESSDGGIYKRNLPRTTTGAWVSLNGDLQVTEYHGIAWDAVSDRALGGSQDNGTTRQRDATTIFDAISTGDGGDVAVEDRVSATESVRYTSFQFLGNLRRQLVNNTNTVTQTQFPALTVLNAGPAISAQFYTPIAVSDGVAAGDTANRLRLLIGANNGVYESLDGGGTVTLISPVSPLVRVNAFRGDPIVYGAVGNPGYILLGGGTPPATNGVYVRPNATGTLAQVGTLPAAVQDLAVDPDDVQRVVGLTSNQVLLSTNGGAVFGDVTGNLVSGFAPGVLRTMAYVPGATDTVVVGADRGVFVASAPSFNSWTRLGTGLPNAVVFELEYDRQDQVLIAGLLGRGAWRLTTIQTEALFSNGFEP